MYRKLGASARIFLLFPNDREINRFCEIYSRNASINYAAAIFIRGFHCNFIAGNTKEDPMNWFGVLSLDESLG